MNISKHHGKILIIIGVVHSLFGLTPWAFGDTFSNFSHSFFFMVNPGLSDFPLLGGMVNTEDFAAFWFVYFGLLLIPLGLLLHQFIKLSDLVPLGFATAYFVVVLLGAYMIPFSGMTIIMLPHAILILRDSRSNFFKKNSNLN